VKVWRDHNLKYKDCKSLRAQFYTGPFTLVQFNLGLGLNWILGRPVYTFLEASLHLYALGPEPEQFRSLSEYEVPCVLRVRLVNKMGDFIGAYHPAESRGE